MYVCICLRDLARSLARRGREGEADFLFLGLTGANPSFCLLSEQVSQRRLDDYTIIGATVGSLFTSVSAPTLVWLPILSRRVSSELNHRERPSLPLQAIFLKRARWFWLVPGGAGLGVLGGTITSVVQSLSSSTSPAPDPPPAPHLFTSSHYVKKEVVEGQPKRFSDGLRATSA